MSRELRILLLLGVLSMAYLIIKKIRKSTFEIEDSLLWIFSIGILVFVAVFPDFFYYISSLLGLTGKEGIFLLLITLLFFKVFTQSMSLSKNKEQIKSLSRYLAFLEKEEQEKKANHGDK